ncbi:MAG: pseudouridine synthase, partial [Geobacteraceae bacterium]|nr:pseudouridine synthase [Geobacteraceae bacterium]
MKERLQKILSRAGVSSRRAAEEIILAGRVTVNGVVVDELGAKADPDQDTITVDGKRIGTDTARVYLVLYKPAGYMTTLKDPQGRPLVTDLLKGIRERVYPVGRLDYNTEGLLLLTNDGEWANTLAHPRHEVDKEYHVRVQGQVSPVQIQRLAAGVELEDGMTAPALVRVVRESENNTWLSITIHEGRYRQVRRMCEAVGLSVVRLKRARYGFLGLEGLTAGKYRFLTSEESERLLQSSRGDSAVQTPAPSFEKRCAQR